MLIVGPPGAGKSLAARRLPRCCLHFGVQEAIEVTRIASVRSPAAARDSGRPPVPCAATDLDRRARRRWQPPRPGEATLAHGGVLFLDELGEFSRQALEAMRQPLEDGSITVTRARHSIELPCRFMCSSRRQPLPLRARDSSERCRCSEASVRRYEAKLSGALADRIDISLSVEQPSPEALRSAPRTLGRGPRARRGGRGTRGPGAPPRRRALQRGHDASRDTPRVPARRAGRRAAGAQPYRLGLSGRGYERVLEARTLADLEESIASARVTSATR